MVGTAYLRILSRRASLIIRISARPRGRQAAGRGGLRKRRSKRLTVPLGMTALGMATGVGVEWVRASKAAAGAGKPPEELEAELRELRDEVRRLREQMAALATASTRPAPEDERIPTFVGRLDAAIEGGVRRGEPRLDPPDDAASGLGDGGGLHRRHREAPPGARGRGGGP